MNRFFSDRTKKTGKNVVKYILELLVVSFGVYLGIYVGERNSQQKTDTNTKKALTQIITELNSNTGRLKSAISYHEQIGIELDSVVSSLERDDYNTLYFENEKFNHNKSLPSWNGINTVKLSSTIFESAKIGGVLQELNISTINLISSAYEFQNIYDDLSKATVKQMMEMDSQTKTSDVIQLLSRLSKYDVVNMEKGLLNHIETNVTELKKSIENKTYNK